jgi:hypothetical protein
VMPNARRVGNSSLASVPRFGKRRSQRFYGAVVLRLRSASIANAVAPSQSAPLYPDRERKTAQRMRVVVASALCLVRKRRTVGSICHQSTAGMLTP